MMKNIKKIDKIIDTFTRNTKDQSPTIFDELRNALSDPEIDDQRKASLEERVRSLIEEYKNPQSPDQTQSS